VRAGIVSRFASPTARETIGWSRQFGLVLLPSPSMLFTLLCFFYGCSRLAVSPPHSRQATIRHASCHKILKRGCHAT
jgi:hypothetical protein